MSKYDKTRPEFAGDWNNDRYNPVNLVRMEQRASVAAKFIKPGSSVLDLGCGHRLIRPYLPDGCRYYGVDKFPVAPDVPVIDLDKHEFPDGVWDYVLMLGLLAAVREQRWTLNAARERCRYLIVSLDRRTDYGTERQLRDTGWDVIDSLTFRNDRKKHIDVLLCGYFS